MCSCSCQTRACQRAEICVRTRVGGRVGLWLCVRPQVSEILKCKSYSYVKSTWFGSAQCKNMNYLKHARYVKINHLRHTHANTKCSVPNEVFLVLMLFLWIGLEQITSFAPHTADYTLRWCILRRHRAIFLVHRRAYTKDVVFATQIQSTQSVPFQAWFNSEVRHPRTSKGP